MKALSKDEMLKATRLTRAGKLMEAVGVLRGMLSPGAASPPATPAAPAAARGLLGRLTGLAPRPAKAPAWEPAQGGRFEARRYAGPAGQRDYKLYIPSRYRGQEVRLVVMLHGCTQSPDDFAAGTRMNVLAEEEIFLVAYPAQSQSANMQRCWNWYRPTDQQRGTGEPEIIAGITREVMAEFSVKTGQVYAAGLSAGGALAAILGVRYPELYAAIGVHSGLACGAASDMGSAFAAMRRGGAAASTPSRVPTILFHGDRDQTVNSLNAEQVAAQADENWLTASVTEGHSVGGVGYTKTIHRDAAGRAMTEKWILHGAGHAWSGGSKAGSFTDPNRPDASREMLRFFAETAGGTRRFRGF